MEMPPGPNDPAMPSPAVGAAALAVDPVSDYTRRLEARRVEGELCAASDGRFANARGAAFLAGLGAALLAWRFPQVSPWWLLLPAVVFVVLVVLHDGVRRRWTLAKKAIRYYQVALARMEDRWPGNGPDGARYADPHHPFSSDLDLFGRGSLFQLLCCARTRAGEDTLASWMAGLAEAAVVHPRQHAVAELTNSVDLREQLALLDAEVHDELDPQRLLAWCNSPAHPVSWKWRLAAGVLGVAGAASVVAWLAFDAGLSPLILVLLAELALAWPLRARFKEVARSADEAGNGLRILSQVLSIIEQQKFQSDGLRMVSQRLETEDDRPSVRIAQLHQRIQNLVNTMQNQLFAPIAFLLGLPVHFLHAIEAWRADTGAHVAEWLQSAGEFEALMSLGGYAFEHPHDRFPEVTSGPPGFHAEGMAHPLLPAVLAVRNDFSIGSDLRLVIVSGSNMSGKSTLMRTIGINLVLALAGAPVRAQRLTTTPLQIGTAMRVHDSLQQGMSLFFAVITRLKQIVDLSRGPQPLLFLIDEILQGTNSRDRRTGAEGVIRKLVDNGAMGVVTTHDLALTEIVGSFGNRAINIHFEDRLEDGRMIFDYRIRPGVVERSNALELMRMMGLGDDQV